LPVPILICALVSLIFLQVTVPLIANAQSTQTKSASSPSATNSHVLSFGSAWHYAGNETISGELATTLCSIPPMLCLQFPKFAAEKYVNKNGTALDLVTRWEGQTNESGNVTIYEYDIVVVQSSVSCFATNATLSQGYLSQYFSCPKVIDSHLLFN